MRIWTNETKAQQRAAIHNWKPWEKSTGAKTAAGKAIVSTNACKGYKRPLRQNTRQGLKAFLSAANYLLMCVSQQRDLFDAVSGYAPHEKRIDGLESARNRMIRKYKKHQRYCQSLR